MSFCKDIFRTLLVLVIVFMISSCSEDSAGHYYEKNIDNTWLIQSSDSVFVDGRQISSVGFDAAGWFPADVPSTVLHTLVKNGVYKDIFMNDNLDKIPTETFLSSWWYRSEFNIDSLSTALVLHIEGINYKANIWLNGILVADTTQVKNAFRQFALDISANRQKGMNVLAIEVFPPKTGDFSIGFVDWNPTPPDNNMGIFRNVYLEFVSDAVLVNPFIVSKLSDDLSEALLTASVEVTNYLKGDFSGEVVIGFEGKKLGKSVELKAGETKKIIFTSSEYEELVVKNPTLWWPHSLGEPHLYDIGFELIENGKTYDKKSLDFGIRTVSDYFTEEGHRGFIINGEKISIRGGGWVDQILLGDTPESIKNQLKYVKDMNLNTIRLEGFWGKDQTLYQLCDEMGILIMVGWSCHWEWEDYLGIPCDEEFGGILNPSDVDMMSKAWQDQIIWLRNHPSIFSWVGGSDCKPKPELEQKYFKTFAEYDSTRVYLASAKEWESPTGPTGVKMRGPYAYEPPVYWFVDTLYGGAFGFNTETGPGAQVPPLESMKKMISTAHLWPMNSMWDYHSGRNEFNTLDRYTTALEARFGKAKDVADYTKKAQLLNYELMRPMFEAFSAYRYEATGVIQWMLNSAWPETFWQLYDFYLMPNGAYYAAKKASQSHHALYDYARHSIFVVNDKLEDRNDCVLRVRAFNQASELKYEREIKVDLKANSSLEAVKLPTMNWGKPIYFLDMRLLDKNGKEIDNNFYWLAAKTDVLDYDAELPNWYFHTPTKQYADFTALNNLPKVKISSAIKENKTPDYIEFTVELKNDNNHIAFFIHPQIMDKKSGNTILPVLWSDNYISLLPGESRKLTAKINNKYLKDKKPQLLVEGYNLIEE